MGGPCQTAKMRKTNIGLFGAMLAATSVGVGAGIAFGYNRWHEPFDRFANAREVVMKRADDFPKGGILVLGDSTAERLHLPNLCGVAVFNAGISRARADQIAPIAAPLIKSLAPKVVIVMAGTNDRFQNDPWVEDISAFAPRGAVVVDVPEPIARSMGWRAVDPLPPTMLAEDGIHASAEGRAEMKR